MDGEFMGGHPGNNSPELAAVVYRTGTLKSRKTARWAPWVYTFPLKEVAFITYNDPFQGHGRTGIGGDWNTGYAADASWAIVLKDIVHEDDMDSIPVGESITPDNEGWLPNDPGILRWLNANGQTGDEFW